MSKKKKAVSQSDAAAPVANSPIPESLKKKGGDWNKSKVILWFAGQNKDMKAAEATKELEKLGISVKPNIYSQTLSIARKKAGKAGGAKRGRKAKAAPEARIGVGNLIQLAGEFIRAAGGVKAAKAALDELQAIGRL